jgi:hypothetical protein
MIAVIGVMAGIRTRKLSYLLQAEVEGWDDSIPPHLSRTAGPVRNPVAAFAPDKR